MLQIVSKISGVSVDFEVNSIYDLPIDDNLLDKLSFMNFSVMSYILEHYHVYIDGIEYTS